MSPINPIRLYSLPETARLLGIPLYTVRQFVKERKLGVKRVRPNAHPRIPGQAILDFSRTYERAA